MAKRSTEWLRGYVYGLEAHSLTGRAAHLKQVRAELAEAEAREAGEPTAAGLAVADELDMLSAYIQEYIGPDDARDDIRRICRNRAEDLRRGVKRGLSAAEVIAAAERALNSAAFRLTVLQKIGREDVSTNTDDQYTALAAIAKWKEAQR